MAALSSGVAMSNNVISFPKNNRRLDVTNTPVNAEEVAQAIQNMRLDFYHQVSDELMEDLLTKIGSLNLNLDEDVRLEEKQIIFLREVITSFICKIAGVDHPLNSLASTVVTDLRVMDDIIDYKLNVPMDIIPD